ncbi:MAG: SDR family NAD(P)-dependent oxidoreductase, partial [Halieaceae bacterium]
MKTVLVTGSGIGLGKATAMALGDAGYRVIVTDVLSAEGQEVAAAICEAGGAAEYHFLDVCDTLAVDSLCSQVQADYGALYGLVLN